MRRMANTIYADQVRVNDFNKKYKMGDTVKLSFGKDVKEDIVIEPAKITSPLFHPKVVLKDSGSVHLKDIIH